MTEPTAPPANAGRLQGGRFVPGVSGNPTGKKPGTRHRATQLTEKLMADDAEAVVTAVVAAAKGGDMTAARLVLDRFGAADVVQVLAVVADAMARGVLSAEKAQAGGVTDGDGR
jgi:hypothetical protein